VVAINQTPVETPTLTSPSGKLIRTVDQQILPDVVVVIPAYNEARYIGSIVLQARRFTNRVIVVDDGSIDETSQIADCAGATVINHDCNQGKGAALNTGFTAARKFDPQVVVCMDGDGQHNPEEISHLIQPIISREADIVIGSRYLNASQRVPRSRIWGHHLFNLLTRYASGVASSDSQSGFRAFSTQAIEMLSFCSQDFTVESEMQFLAQEYDLQVMEVPVTIDYSDPPKRSILLHGIRVINGILRLVGQHRPLLYFGVSGTAVFTLGVVLGFRVVEIFSRSGQLAVGSALLSLFLSLVGTIMISTGFILHSIRALLIDIFSTKRLK